MLAFDSGHRWSSSAGRKLKFPFTPLHFCIIWLDSNFDAHLRSKMKNEILWILAHIFQQQPENSDSKPKVQQLLPVDIIKKEIHVNTLGFIHHGKQLHFSALSSCISAPSLQLWAKSILGKIKQSLLIMHTYLFLNIVNRGKWASQFSCESRVC